MKFTQSIKLVKNQNQIKWNPCPYVKNEEELKELFPCSDGEDIKNFIYRGEWTNDP